MQSIQQIIATFPNDFDQVVVAGAGEASEYQALKRKGFKHLTLLEADNKRFTRLQQELADDAQVTVLNQALGGSNGKQILTCYTNPDLNSLAEADQLQHFYPNSKELPSQRVDGVTLETLNQQIAIDEQQNNLLILDIQGLEGMVLADTQETELNKYSALIIRTSKEALYAVEPNGFDEAIALLKQQHIDYLVLPEAVPPFVNLLVFRSGGWRSRVREQDALQQQNGQLAKRLIILETELLQSNTEKEEIDVRLAQVSKDNKALLAELQKEKEQVVLFLQEKDDVTSQLTMVTAERKQLSQQKQQLEKQVKEGANNEARFVEENETLHKHNDALSKQLADLTEEKERLGVKNKELEGLLAEQTTNAATFEKELKQQHEKMQSLDAQKHQVQEDMEKLKKDRQELDYRQQKLDAEIEKVEAQLELIKDVVLREKAF